jgi:hypothetical protein
MSMLAVASLSLSSYGFYRSYYGQVPRALVIEWGVDQNRCTEKIDTSAIADLATKYYVVTACGLTDPTVEVLNDKRISISDRFYIAGTPQQISIKFSTEMANALSALRTEGAPTFNLWHKVFIFPKTGDISKVHMLSDISVLGRVLY